MKTEDEWRAELNAANEAWHEQEDELQSLRFKLDDEKARCQTGWHLANEMKADRDRVVALLEQSQKTGLECGALLQTFQQEVYALQSRLHSTTSALGEQSALAAELSLRLLAETNRGHDLQEQVAALQSTEHCANAHDNMETCGWCQRDEALRRLGKGIEIVTAALGRSGAQIDCQDATAWLEECDSVVERQEP